MMRLRFLERGVKKMKDELLKNLVDSITNVTDAESKIYEYCERLDEVQWKIRDIEHYLEKKDITKTGASNLIALLQELRIERRQIKQMWELWNVYGTNREKLKVREWREFLITELHKKDKELQTEYNYRFLSEEYLDQLNTEKPSKRGRPRKNITYNNIEEEEEVNE